MNSTKVMEYKESPPTLEKVKRRLKNKAYSLFKDDPNVIMECLTNDLCKLCGKIMQIENSGKEYHIKWVVEHKHDNKDGTGKFRGKMCYRCNAKLRKYDRMAKNFESYQRFEESVQKDMLDLELIFKLVEYYPMELD